MFQDEPELRAQATTRMQDDPERITKESTWGSHDESWADSMKAYEMRRSTTPWQRTRSEVPSYHRQRESITQTIYNPVIQRFKPDGKNYETVRDVERTLERPASELNQRYDERLKHETSYNIVTGESKLKNHPRDPFNKELEEKPYKPYDSRHNFNIATNMDYADTAQVAPHLRPEREPIEHFEPREHPGRAALRRDYDIASNNYIKDHETRAQQDAEHHLNKAYDTMRRTKVFDPVTGEIQGDRGHDTAAKEASKVKRAQYYHERDLPPYVKRSDSRAFDLLSNEVKDSSIASALKKKDSRTGQRILRNEAAAKYKQLEQVNQATEDRTLARPNPQAWHEEYGRGYDITTNQPFAGVKAKTVAFPKARPRLTPYDRLTLEAEPAKLFETQRKRAAGTR
ncbi:hypothetical protein J8273_8132 [Carpediemonas membranifera]|uniref:Uncharacterized protein n=1 Tax=Carpediemonas membranifera TaxID=201153 RepID=A0A8J6AR67_9EUKA|nr:hypothetical protein J8273_8132 [Carpediemonas membranifera]|eukprot:KAG9390095.1 hypothetical protein J8273_8132 [Carpediemonas membranifera]